MCSYLDTGIKSQCFGCEACMQICPKAAIGMFEDEEGFRYPRIDKQKCVDCGMCRAVCPYCRDLPERLKPLQVWGGYHKDEKVRRASSSGGVFSAIVDTWCDDSYVIFGASVNGLDVFHEYITDKAETGRFRKSKYSQSRIGNTYVQARDFLRAGKKVLFSGTPCQIFGLQSFLHNENQERLITVEVVCEGVPTPHFMRRYAEHIKQKYGAEIKTLDYRYKLDSPISGKWDYQVMYTLLHNNKGLKTDRWFNPFWSIWLRHLMSRPSCYECPYACLQRNADITLGDLWGVHIYCPELYGKNGGSSLVLANTEKGLQVLEQAKAQLFGHNLKLDEAIKYQAPLRKHIDKNSQRESFMQDVLVLPYKELCQKWAKKPKLKLLWQKYIWGNYRKIALWKFKQKILRKRKKYN